MDPGQRRTRRCSSTSPNGASTSSASPCSRRICGSLFFVVSGLGLRALLRHLPLRPRSGAAGPAPTPSFSIMSSAGSNAGSTAMPPPAASLMPRRGSGQIRQTRASNTLLFAALCPGHRPCLPELFHLVARSSTPGCKVSPSQHASVFVGVTALRRRALLLLSAGSASSSASSSAPTAGSSPP